MKKSKNIILLVLFVGILTNCHHSDDNDNLQQEVLTEKSEHIHNKEDNEKFISHEIHVFGDVENELFLTIDSLRAMKIVELDTLQIVCQSGATTTVENTSKGVLLRDVLDKAKIKQLNHKDRNFYIVARATDNYKATFSWAEIYNSETGNNVYVLVEENGKLIKEKGDMVLISNSDIKTGPRHVTWLNSIEVYRVD